MIAVILAAGFVTVIAVFTSLVPRKTLDNYEWQVKDKIRTGNTIAAEDILRMRIAQEYYDFSAQRLLAEILIDTGRFQDAITLLTETIKREQLSKQKAVYNYAYDSYATHKLLADALQKLGRTQEAAIASSTARNVLAGSARGISRNLVEIGS